MASHPARKRRGVAMLRSAGFQYSDDSTLCTSWRCTARKAWPPPRADALRLRPWHPQGPTHRCTPSKRTTPLPTSSPASPCAPIPRSSPFLACSKYWHRCCWDSPEGAGASTRNIGILMVTHDHQRVCITPVGGPWLVRLRIWKGRATADERNRTPPRIGSRRVESTSSRENFNSLPEAERRRYASIYF